MHLCNPHPLLCTCAGYPVGYTPWCCRTMMQSPRMSLPAPMLMKCSRLKIFWFCRVCTGKRFVSADRKGEIRLWDPTTGQQQGQPVSAHKQWITSLAWEPLHRNSSGERLASSSKDALIKVCFVTKMLSPFLRRSTLHWSMYTCSVSTDIGKTLLELASCFPE